jgi:hypothetical protein
MRLPDWLKERLFSSAFDATWRDPDLLIGPENNPYLRRWWLVPRNPFLNVYLHNIRRSDDATRGLHDHPWWSVSVLLKGSYYEIVPLNPRNPRGRTQRLFWRSGSVIFRGAKHAHRLEVTLPKANVWTLFITGPRFRQWGFWEPEGWRAHDAL